MRKLWNSLRRWEKIFLVISPILAAPIVAGVIYGIYLDFQPPPPLSPMQKAVFILHEIEQLPAWEIQRISGLSAVQRKSNLYIARQKVRKALIKEGIQY